MAYLRRYLTVLSLPWLGALSGAASSPPVPERHITFTVFSAEPVANLAYVPRVGAAAVPLVFYPTARSPHYAYAGPALVQLFDAPTGALAAEISVPPGIPHALFILSARENVAGGVARYRVQIVDDSLPRHPAGSLLILNLSGLALSGTVNGRHRDLTAGFNAAIRVGESASVNLRTPFRNRSYQAFANTIRLDPSGRCLLLLLPPFHRGSLEVQSRILRDAPPPAGGKKTPE